MGFKHFIMKPRTVKHLTIIYRVEMKFNPYSSIKFKKSKCIFQKGKFNAALEHFKCKISKVLLKIEISFLYMLKIKLQKGLK